MRQDENQNRYNTYTRSYACVYKCTICNVPRQYGHGDPEDREAIVQLLCEGDCLTADPTPHRYYKTQEDRDAQESTIQTAIEPERSNEAVEQLVSQDS